MNPVRELAPGERPADWIDTAESSNDADDSNESAPPVGLVAPEAPPAPVAPVAPEAPEQHAAARLEPQRFSVQFTAGEEYVKLVEEAKALLSHSAPRVSLDELHLRAMRAFVTELKKQKYAVTAEPRSAPAKRLGPRACRAATPTSPRRKPWFRAGAVDTSPPPYGARSSNATRSAARSATFPGSAAAKPTASSSTT